MPKNPAESMKSPSKIRKSSRGSIAAKPRPRRAAGIPKRRTLPRKGKEIRPHFKCVTAEERSAQRKNTKFRYTAVSRGNCNTSPTYTRNKPPPPVPSPNGTAREKMRSALMSSKTELLYKQISSGKDQESRENKAQGFLRDPSQKVGTECPSCNG